MPQNATRNIADILTLAAEYLVGKNIENAGLVCKLLMSRLLRCKHLELALRFGEILSEKQLAAMRRGVKRVADGEPVQYVLGQTEFMGHTMKTDKRALIPRPETEELVETVLQCQPLWDKPKPSVIDVGTGCGCIIVSIALARPEGLYIGFDTAAEALDLARQNAVSLGIDEKIAFSDTDLSDSVEPESIDAIVANLPYIPTAEWERLPEHIRDHEPRAALDGGPDGLSAIRVVVQNAAFALKTQGFIFLEIGEDQGQAVTSLLKQTGFEQIDIKQDLAGKDRIVTGTLGG